MLKSSRELVLEYQQRRGRRRIYPPHIHWAKWLYTGGGEDEALPAEGRKANRQGESDEHAGDEADMDGFESEESLLKSNKKGDLEDTAGLGYGRQEISNVLPPPQKRAHKMGQRPESVPQSPWLRIREKLAGILEWLQGSDDVIYAFRLVVAMFLVLWPAFVASWNTWYSLNRGCEYLDCCQRLFKIKLSTNHEISSIVWAALQLILIAEVSIGTSVMTFFLRAIGTTLGCLWGWAAWESRRGNPIVCSAMICIGLIPATYVQLGTKYPKAGQVSIMSMCVVALTTELEAVPGRVTWVDCLEF